MEKAVFAVDIVDFDLRAAQQGNIDEFTAEQYLSFVKFEANLVPDVIRADSVIVNSKPPHINEGDYEQAIPTKADEQHEFLLPTLEWEEQLLLRFEGLRLYISTLSETVNERKIVVPPMKLEKAWEVFCFGAGDSDETHECLDVNNNHGLDKSSQREKEEDKVEEDDVDEANRNASINTDSPLETDISRQLRKRKLELMSCNSESLYTEVDVIETLPKQTEIESVGAESSHIWDGLLRVKPTVSLLLQFDQVLTQRLLEMHTNWLMQRNFTEARGLWLFSLLAHLETPIYRDTAACIRILYRRCRELRSSCDRNDTLLSILNMLICISGSYFGQGEEYAHLSHDGNRDDNDEDESNEESEVQGEDDDNESGIEDNIYNS